MFVARKYSLSLPLTLILLDTEYIKIVNKSFKFANKYFAQCCRKLLNRKTLTFFFASKNSMKTAFLCLSALHLAT